MTRAPAGTPLLVSLPRSVPGRVPTPVSALSSAWALCWRAACAACSAVPRATVPLTPAVAACTPLTVEAAADLGAFKWEPHARLVTDAAGQVHAVWTQDEIGTDRAVYFHGEPHGAGLRITRDLFPGESLTKEFSLTRVGGRPAIVTWDGTRRGPALLAGPPWRHVLPLTSLITAPDAAGHLYTIAFMSGEVTLLRVDGEALTPVARAPYPGRPPQPDTRDEPELRTVPGGLALVFWVPPPPLPPRPSLPDALAVALPEDYEPAVQPPTRAALRFTGLSGPAPSARLVDPAEVEPAHVWNSQTQTFLTYTPADGTPVSVALADNRPLGIEHCGEEGRSGWRPAHLPRTCRARPTVQTFTPPRSVLTRPGETVVVGTEWTDRSTVKWRTPICSNDRAPAGWYEEKKRGSGRLIVARVPHGGPACTQVLPLALGARPDGQGTVAAAVDGTGRLHLLTWTYGRLASAGRLRYLRLR